ncbi:DUF5677 domain-containing protein [Phenylobacterium sp.]|uniref:DUF5677 domain-containing protein n=1 Tax=Phenylobacterium sp. TaxID=1871053 RepID=UPI002726A615|nr:DUF5677 domain-containing protein [Phenylobacterium sp.]MDO8379566.1 DUF5677 domain-containing protein [Phenylobacterium sp.]
MSAEIVEIRTQNGEWFALAEDLNEVLQKTAVRAIEVNRGDNFTPGTVATRLLLRSCGTFQAALLMAERGMVTEGQTLARSLLENAFCLAAIHEKPEKFIELLRADAEAARRMQGQFVIAQGLSAGSDPATQTRLREVVAAIGKDLNLLSPKKVAAMGPFIRQYLAYQKLSNDAAHPSATSLHRFMATTADRSAWIYRWGPGKDEEIAFTLSQAIHAATSVGVAFTQLTEDFEHNRMLGPLADRLKALPETHGRVGESSISL